VEPPFACASESPAMTFVVVVLYTYLMKAFPTTSADLVFGLSIKSDTIGDLIFPGFKVMRSGENRRKQR